MSHSHGRALADKQNVLHAFSKHFKPRGESGSPVNLCTSNCICSSSHDKNKGTQHGQKPSKTKRLKTRKKRSHLRDGDRGGPKIATQSHHHHQYRKEKLGQCHDSHHQCCKEKAQCHDFCQISSRRPPLKDASFARVFPTAQEPSIITESRLIGHHGLFNHEVKSFDIERLLSEQRKLEKLGQNRRPQKNDSAFTSPPPLTSPQLLSSLVPECDTGNVDVCTTKKARDKTRAERTTTSTKKSKRKTDLDNNASCGDVGTSKTTMQVHVEEQIPASYDNSQGTDLPCGQTHQGSLTSDSDAVLLSSTDTSDAPAANQNLVVPEMGRESKLPHGREQRDSRPQDTQTNVVSLEQTPKNIGLTTVKTQQSHERSFSPSPELTLSSDRRGAGEGLALQQSGAACGADPVSAVAARLCRSLELPLLRRRRLLEESREVLLHTLQERHGPQLQHNLLRVHRQLGFGSTPTAARHARSTASAEEEEGHGVWSAASFDAGCGEDGVKEPSVDLKRRRKQRCPLRVSPPQVHTEPAQGRNQSVPWANSPSVEQEEDVFGELFRRPSSSHFPMDIQSSGVSMPHPMFDPPPAPYWGPAFPPQSSDVGFNRRPRETTSMDCFETWTYDTDMSFLNGTREALEGSSTRLLQRQDPFGLEKTHLSSSESNSSALAQRLLESRQLRPFYRFNRDLPSPTPMSHSADMAYYSPCHMLESGLSPAPSSLPAFPSPECWSFPRMRLY